MSDHTPTMIDGNDQDQESTAEIMPGVIPAISYLLKRVSEMNHDLSRPFRRHQRISGFHGLTRPSISIRSYMERIFKYANCSHSCYIVAYIYLDRFMQKQPFLPIDSFNVHRLIITSVLVSSKFMDDMCYSNAYYARVGGISTEEMNILELDFLFGIAFHLNVAPSTFHHYSCFLHALEPSPPARSSPHKKFHINLREDESTLQKQLAAV
ncbi:PREDICTED: cyclin-U4-2-like [Tarenaya hassleriana]|uniref:cyclin-U4-2-like n=1 Tax=Tarenaya hassleriana TaxID=28532 RepID=UPI00053C606B|nr:PREDICTED: cyclin-U4-2-like [Tarenaya hassleriana]